MQTTDLKQEAIERIIFHATPREWLTRGGPWVLERGEGALLYDADGREYLDALSGGLFAVLAGYGREEIARAMFEQARRLNYTNPYATTSPVTIAQARPDHAGRPVGLVLLQQRLGGGRGCDQARPPVPPGQRSGRAVQGRLPAARVPRLHDGSPVGHRLEPRLRGLPT
jgi:hypothetical protein